MYLCTLIGFRGFPESTIWIVRKKSHSSFLFHVTEFLYATEFVITVRIFQEKYVKLEDIVACISREETKTIFRLFYLLLVDPTMMLQHSSLKLDIVDLKMESAKYHRHFAQSSFSSSLLSIIRLKLPRFRVEKISWEARKTVIDRAYGRNIRLRSLRTCVRGCFRFGTEILPSEMSTMSKWQTRIVVVEWLSSRKRDSKWYRCRIFNIITLLAPINNY